MKVTWNANKCCHAGICVNTLPAVFSFEDEELIIDTTKAGEEEITKVVRLCLADALKIEE